MMSETREKIGIIGVGRLGLCTALIFESIGYDVLAVDLAAPYVDALNNRTFKSHEPLVSEWLQKTTNFHATLSIDEVLEYSDLIWILVDTPTGIGKKSYDHSKLSRVLDSINERKVKGKHFVIGCTVLPGYIANTARYLLSDCTDTTVNYNPEFIAQGEIMNGFLNPDLVLIGEETTAAGDAIQAIYDRFIPKNAKMCRMSVESAEITKLALNCMITARISFANMVGDIADRTDNADKYAILAAVGSDSRVGPKYLRPGFGFGGPCFPRDNRALGNYAEMLGIDPIVSKATDEYNQKHAEYMTEAFLAEKRDVYVFEDVAYKANCAVPIIEESQKLEVAERLVRRGCQVTIRDRAMIIREVRRVYGRMFSYEITDQ